MTGPDEVLLDRPEDDALLARLRAVAAEVDPVPADVRALASAALALRDLDAELAVLVHDSEDLDDRAQELVGVRGSADDVRLLSYDAPALGVELQVVQRGDRRDVLGQVVGETVALVLETAPTGAGTGTTDHPLVPDADGLFRLDDLPAGRFRVRLRTPGGLTVLTPWTTL